MNTSCEWVNTKEPTNIIGDHCPSRFWQSFLLWTKKVKIIGLLSYQYGIPAPSKGERATFPFDLTQVRSSGGVRNSGRFLVGRPSQAHTMGMIPCWITSFPPTEKKKKTGQDHSKFIRNFCRLPFSAVHLLSSDRRGDSGNSFCVLETLQFRGQ